MTGGTFLLLRRRGAMWGVPGELVSGLESTADGVTVRVASASLRADAVLGLARKLEVRPGGALLQAYWQEGCGGVAVHDGVPLVIVDAARLPRALLE